MGTIFVLRGANVIPTYSKVLTFQQAKKYVKWETFEKSPRGFFCRDLARNAQMLIQLVQS